MIWDFYDLRLTKLSIYNSRGGSRISMSKNQKVLCVLRWINLFQDVWRRKYLYLSTFVHFPQVLVEEGHAAQSYYYSWLWCTFWRRMHSFLISKNKENRFFVHGPTPPCNSRSCPLNSFTHIISHSLHLWFLITYLPLYMRVNTCLMSSDSC